MNHATGNRFSGPITAFQGYRLPERGTPAGYAALIDAYRLNVPLPRTLCAIGERHRIIVKDGWRILTPRRAPQATLEGHLTFALKPEGLDLAVLKRLFEALTPGDIDALVRAKPTGGYARSGWFLYEWLTSRWLDLPNAERGSYVPVVIRRFNGQSKVSILLGTGCGTIIPEYLSFVRLFSEPTLWSGLLRWTWPARARAVVAQTPRDVRARGSVLTLEGLAIELCD